MDAAGRTAEKTLREIGICFLFAKNHHPAMARIQPIRQKLAKRTIFNLMGPLSNPAQVRRQLIGIARPALCPDLCRCDGAARHAAHLHRLRR